MDSGVAAIILDFDGVILESAALKAQVFEELFARYPDVQDRAVAFHRARPGISRERKFGHLVNDLLGRSDPALVSSLSAEFGCIVEERIATCHLVTGAAALLTRWHGRVPLYVASSTPETELVRIVARLGLRSFFARVAGDTGPKPRLVAGLVADEHLVPTRTWFLGDSVSDFEAAVASGVHFIGIGHNIDLRARASVCVADLVEADRYLTAAERGEA